MPFRDGTGPMGDGRPGWGRGPCAGGWPGRAGMSGRGMRRLGVGQGGYNPAEQAGLASQVEQLQGEVKALRAKLNPSGGAEEGK